jgi:GNAT superfamily N-acetyltransferase
MHATASLLIEAVDPQHPQALALLREAAREARALYPELFALGAPAPTNPPLRSREVYLLASREGKALGCGALRQHDAFTGELQRMFVARAARRDGVARALLARLEHEARQHGYRQLVLETGARQQPAIALYSACGWRRIAAYGTYAGDPMSVCFGKALALRR